MEGSKSRDELATKEKLAIVVQRTAIAGNAHLDLLRRNLRGHFRSYRRRGISAVQRKPGRQFDGDLILFGPGIVEINRILPVRR